MLDLVSLRNTHPPAQGNCSPVSHISDEDRLRVAASAHPSYVLLFDALVCYFCAMLCTGK